FCNVLTFAGIMVGSLLGPLLAAAGLDSGALLIAAALITLAATIWAVYLLPEAFVRLILVLFTPTFYRLRVIGGEKVPLEGGALLAPNHVTFVDAMLLITSIDRPIRFLVDASYFHHWLYKPFMHALGAISISASGGPRMILRALKDAGAYLDKGEVVCIFPEGQLTRTGTLLPFQRGLERIVKGRHCPGHSGVHGSRLGQHFQPFGRAVPVEDSGTHSVSDHGDVRQAVAGGNAYRRGAPRGTGPE